MFFQTQVYPVLSLFKLGDLKENDITLWHPNSTELNDFNPSEYSRSIIPSKMLEALPDHIWGFLLSSHSDLLLKLIEDSVTLESLAEVRATTAASEADDYSTHLVNDKPQVGFRVVNTGTIDVGSNYSVVYFSSLPSC